MKVEGLKPYKDKIKTDFHTKKLFANSNEKPIKGTKSYYKKNQYLNWWENMCVDGAGKIKESIIKTIKEGIDIYEEEKNGQYI